MEYWNIFVLFCLILLRICDNSKQSLYLRKDSIEFATTYIHVNLDFWNYLLTYYSKLTHKDVKIAFVTIYYKTSIYKNVCYLNETNFKKCQKYILLYIFCNFTPIYLKMYLFSSHLKFFSDLQPNKSISMLMHTLFDHVI